MHWCLWVSTSMTQHWRHVLCFTKMLFVHAIASSSTKQCVKRGLDPEHMCRCTQAWGEWGHDVLDIWNLVGWIFWNLQSSKVLRSRAETSKCHRAWVDPSMLDHTYVIYCKSKKSWLVKLSSLHSSWLQTYWHTKWNPVTCIFGRTNHSLSPLLHRLAVARTTPGPEIVCIMHSQV